MSWIQIRFYTKREQTQILDDLLQQFGASAVTFLDAADQPILEPIKGVMPLWDDTEVMGLFEADVDAKSIVEQMSLLMAAAGEKLPRVKIEILEDKDWEREWMERFQPIQCGEKLWITPSWKEPPQPDAVNLMLDPGLAFGTGTHPTTFMCLQWLDANSNLVANAQAIDYGCGSGILGIAAILLGAKHFVGVDNDPQAITATNDNASRNNIGVDKFKVYLPEDYDKIEADIVLANILAGPLIALQTNITDSLRSGGALVLSGILHNQYEEVMRAYEHVIDFDPVEQQDQWIRLSGRKR